jgi:hypothetical protein
MHTDISPVCMKTACFIFVVFVQSVAVTAMDFTPQYAETVQDGIPVKRLYFSDHAQRIYLSVPNGWRVTGNSHGSRFTPESLRQASVILENSALGTKIAFAGESLDPYRKDAAGLLPAGASDVHADFERTGEVAINGWSSFETAFTYNFYGQNFTTSVLFINIDKETQIRLRVTARKEDFEKLYPQARRTVASWFAPPPDLEAVLQRVSAGRK